MHEIYIDQLPLPQGDHNVKMNDETRGQKAKQGKILKTRSAP